jgi:RNA polymerase sigma-70 factor (ECF subfamily)
MGGTPTLDVALVVRARAGEHDAFATLAAGSIDGLYRLARMILRDPAIAEDVVQDTLLAAWQGLPALREPERFEAWLRQLLVRSCTRAGWRYRRDRVHEVGLDGLERATRDDQERSLVVRDLLERGFEGLATDERALLVLHFYVELSVPEIADALGVPAGTVKSRIHRASHRMRALLDADDRLSTVPTGAVR